MQKSVVSLSAGGYTPCPAFAVLRHVTGSQTIETQSELLNMFSSFQYFIDLNFSQVQIGCFPSLKGHSELLGLLELSAFEATVLVFGLSRLGNLFLSNDEVFSANKFSWIVALEASHSLKTSKFPPVVGDLGGTAATVLSVAEKVFLLLSSGLLLILNLMCIQFYLTCSPHLLSRLQIWQWLQNCRAALEKSVYFFELCIDYYVWSALLLTGYIPSMIVWLWAVTEIPFPILLR